MDPVTVMADVQLAIKLAKMAYDAGVDMYPYVKTAYQIMFENKVLTTEERQTITNQEIAWRKDIATQVTEDDTAVD